MPTSTTAATSTTTPATEATTTPPVSGGPITPADGAVGPIGVVGCSNSEMSVYGYLKVSNEDKLVTGDLGGGAESIWGNPSDREYSKYWGAYDGARPGSGYNGVWIQVCLRTPDHLGAFDADEQNWTSHIVEQIHARDPGIPIWISGVNSYAGGAECSSIGPDGPAIAAQTADWAAQNLTGVSRGPDLGPLLPGDIGGRDDCHPNEAGQVLLGAQLADFFD